MAEFLLELFSEEIPARMQEQGARDLARLVTQALAPLPVAAVETFHGPRRIAMVAQVSEWLAETALRERGPRLAAPAAALDGFLRKHNASRDELHSEGEFWVLTRRAAGRPAGELIAERMPALLRRFPWPKSMRWGGTSAFTWVRPLHRILCLLDGEVVSFSLADGADDGHGLASADRTEGHRLMSANPLTIRDAAQWQEDLARHHVVVDAAQRSAQIGQSLRAALAPHDVTLVEDPRLLAEVAGLVEWPIALVGRIDPSFMDLPAEVMQVSMRTNQRYFATRDRAGRPAPFFAFVANLAATDAGRAIVSGNERVLRARFADARYFWDHDRAVRLEQRLETLTQAVFHAQIGSQWDRARRLARLAAHLAPRVGAEAAAAHRAGLLAKADLTTGMVGEFPELQGIMGGYYAHNDGEQPAIAQAISEHYRPEGPSDPIPRAPLSIAVALADKLDLLAQFFAINIRPSGSSDPFGLRRAAIGIIRIIRENGLRLGLCECLAVALDGRDAVVDPLLAFLLDRLRIQLRAEGARHDVLAAIGSDDDLVRLLARTEAVAALLQQADGVNLLAAYRRAANILRIEEKKDGPIAGPVDRASLVMAQERALLAALDRLSDIPRLLKEEHFSTAMTEMARLRVPLDQFFDKVTVNYPDHCTRANRLRLLALVRSTIDLIADFSRIEG